MAPARAYPDGYCTSRAERPSRPRRPRVRGCFQVEVVSFSRRIVFSRIPFVSCLYSIVCSIRKHEEYSEDTIYKIRLDTCVVSSILQYGVDTIRIQLLLNTRRIHSWQDTFSYPSAHVFCRIQHTVRILLKAQLQYPCIVLCIVSLCRMLVSYPIRSVRIRAAIASYCGISVYL